MSSHADAVHRKKRRKLLAAAILFHRLWSQPMIPPFPMLLTPPITTSAPVTTPLIHLELAAIIGTIGPATKSSPHPEQGGKPITYAHLLQLGIDHCLWAFGFTPLELFRLSRVMDIPSPLKTPSGYTASALEALALLCAHLRCEGSQWMLVTQYARSQSAVSEIITEVTGYLDRRWGFLLEWDAGGLVHPRHLQEYATAIRDFGAPCNSVFGWIDCTIRPTCRPTRFQELAYTGYKKCHGMKFQAIAIPNGIIAHLSGPYRAPQNDNGVLRESGIVEVLERHAIQLNSQLNDPPHLRYFQVYGDSAYGLSPVLLSPFCEGRNPITAEQRAWNAGMGSVRISVEHSFARVVNQWPQLNCRWRQRIWGTRCGLMYRVGVLLTNAKSCLEPNQTAQRYKILPPSIEDYFHAQ